MTTSQEDQGMPTSPSRRRRWSATPARLEATLTRHLGNTSVPVAALVDQRYMMTVGIGTPPQPHDHFIDTGSDLIWTQCTLFRCTRRPEVHDDGRHRHAPQPHDHFIDTGSDLIWTQCTLFCSTVTPRQPPYDSDMYSIAFLPCSSRLCREGYPGTKSCPNKMCLFDRLWKYGGGPCARVGHLQLRRQPQGIR
jgi:hypothetical protein